MTQRADLHHLLYTLAAPNLTLKLNSHVKSVDPSGPSCILTSGEVLDCDLIIGADGVKSVIRDHVLGAETKLVSIGDAAYRYVIFHPSKFEYQLLSA